jgi:hypothetical protein
LIQLRLLVFEISPWSIQVLKGEVSPATKPRRARPTGTFHICSPNSSHSVIKIAVIFPGNCLQHHVVSI